MFRFRFSIVFILLQIVVLKNTQREGLIYSYTQKASGIRKGKGKEEREETFSVFLGREPEPFLVAPVPSSSCLAPT